MKRFCGRRHPTLTVGCTPLTNRLNRINRVVRVINIICMRYNWSTISKVKVWIIKISHQHVNLKIWNIKYYIFIKNEPFVFGHCLNGSRGTSFRLKVQSLWGPSCSFHLLYGFLFCIASSILMNWLSMMVLPSLRNIFKGACGFSIDQQFSLTKSSRGNWARDLSTLNSTPEPLDYRSIK